ncbi:NTP transferase domain-containing protein [Rhodococcus sp. NPDC058532]|uniref:NTP transferase domain-containing protein n=1 Tax=Rhodococcus sp. NPDC058532 TaxID=3346540 RepID=UPI00364BE663
MTAEPFDAIVLAGGSGSRMGGVDKPALEVGGRSMLGTALAAVAGASTTVVVGPPRADLDPAIRQVQESPRGAGPVAALAAGLRAVGGSAVVAVLAADLPELTPGAIDLLRSALDVAPDRGAALAVDESGRVQFLLGVWRADVLSARLGELDGVTNQPMKTLVPDTFTRVEMAGISDCDTPADVAAARARATPSASADATPLSIGAARTAVHAALETLPAFPQSPLDAIGSALAQSLRAEEALPRVPVSAMDGYAVAGDGPWLLDTAVRYAGSTDTVVLDPGHAVRIATGAHLPTGADTVIRDEHVDVADSATGGRVVARAPGAPIRDDVRRPGEDWLPGSLLATPGTAVTPALASVALSAEVSELLVRGPVRGHVVVTGDEIRRDGPLRDGQTRDSLGPVLPRFLAWCGVPTLGDTHLRDTAGGFDELLGGDRSAVDADLLVMVGATGGGAADHLRAALERAGARIVVGRVRCRPGGSQIAATLPDGRIVLGLPGNPYAAVATLLLMVPTVVAALTGAPQPDPVVGLIANAAEIDSDVTRLVPATLGPDGRWRVEAQVRTAHLGALVRAQALAVIEPGTPDGGSAELLLLPH